MKRSAFCWVGRQELQGFRPASSSLGTRHESTGSPNANFSIEDDTDSACAARRSPAVFATAKLASHFHGLQGAVEPSEIVRIRLFLTNRRGPIPSRGLVPGP